MKSLKFYISSLQYFEHISTKHYFIWIGPLKLHHYIFKVQVTIMSLLVIAKMKERALYITEYEKKEALSR